MENSMKYDIFSNFRELNYDISFVGLLSGILILFKFKSTSIFVYTCIYTLAFPLFSE